MQKKLVIVILVFILSLITNCQVEAQEIEIIKQVNLDKRIQLTGQVAMYKNNLYIPAFRIPLEIYFYSIVDQEFKKKITYPLERGKTPELHLYNDQIFFVDRPKSCVVFLDLNGKVVRTISLQNTHAKNEEPGNTFNMLFDGKYLYLNNHFIKEKAYALQKYDINGKLVGEAQQFPFMQLLKNEDIYAIYFNEVRKLNDKLDTINIYHLKGNDFGNNSRYLFHKNLLVALDSKMNIHITDFKQIYKIIKLKKYFKLEAKTIDDLLLFDNGESLVLIDKITNTIFEFKLGK